MPSDLNIRISTDSDLPQIIDLFVKCLGSDGGVPSEEFWRWKHHSSPFGPSPVLLAFDGETLVGIRTFMRWTWKMNGNEISAYRPVDTATHPDYRGKGIFSRLTRGLVKDISERDPESIIFNTPNDMSKPGYLKMGWQVLGKPDLKAVVYPRSVSRQIIENVSETQIERFIDLYMPLSDKLQTRMSVEFLQWRYQNIPELPYHLYALEDSNGSVLVGIEIRDGRLRQCRICDILYFGEAPAKTFRHLLEGINFIHRPHLFAFIHTNEFKRLVRFPLISLTARKFAPEITIRETGDTALFNRIENIDGWDASIGALSLF